jgi:hypothetical protein
MKGVRLSVPNLIALYRSSPSFPTTLHLFQSAPAGTLLLENIATAHQLIPVQTNISKPIRAQLAKFRPEIDVPNY